MVLPLAKNVSKVLFVILFIFRNLNFTVLFVIGVAIFQYVQFDQVMTNE